MPKSHPTIHDVAESAGVSKSLVSLVLCGSPMVSDKRRNAVLAAIQELGYRPNANARGLAAHRTSIVGVVISDTRNPWFADFLDSFEASLRERGQRTLLGNGRQDGAVQRDLVEAFLELRVDGLCIGGTFAEPDAMTSVLSSVPAVLVHNLDLRLPQGDVVATNYRAGAIQAVGALVEMGHRSIAHLGGPGGVSDERRAGYEAGMREHGLERSIRVEYTDFTNQGNDAAADRLLEGSARPTAVLAVNDLAGMAALAAAGRAGLKVPEQLSVIGADNTRLASLPQVAMTSIDQNSEALGSNAASRLIARIDDPTLPPAEDRVEPELVVRRTTGPPP